MKRRTRSSPTRLLLRLSRLESSAAPWRRPQTREFHVSRACRSRYQFNQALFSISGNVVLADYQAVRIFARKLNEQGAAGGREGGSGPGR